MKTIVILMLATAVPAGAQSHVYTNADLGKPVTSSIRLSPAEAAAIMAAHQPEPLPSARPADGPRVYVMHSSPSDGPFGPLVPFWPAQRLDGSWFSDSGPALYGAPIWFGPTSHGSRTFRPSVSPPRPSTGRPSSAGPQRRR